MNRLVIAPSLLAADFGRLAEERVGRNRFIAPFLPRAGRPHRRKLAFESGAIKRLRPTALRCRLLFHSPVNRCGVVTISSPYAAVCFLDFGGLVWLCLLSKLSP
jgi:hypothetical protein